MAKAHRWLSKEEAIVIGQDPKPNEINRKNARYYITDEEWEGVCINRMTPGERSFVETQIKKGKNGETLSTIEKLQAEPIEVPDDFEIIKISTSKTTGQQWIQYAPKPITETVQKTDFESIIKKYIKPILIEPAVKSSGSYVFDRLVYTDVHVGMTPNQNGYSLYGGKWDANEIDIRLDQMIRHTIKNKKSDTLFIDDLGDFLDGWNQETTRGGHKLPQNMDNEKAYDVGLRFKIKLIDNLVSHYSKIICHNVCEDNHSGSFSYVLNSPFKQLMELRYSNVVVNNVRRFISHYIHGNNCFIITHGKDSKDMKFGFKPILDAKQAEKITNYIDEHNLHGYNIEFSKGDSHLKIFDESTSDLFNYYNYPAFSPSSSWVQTNFKKGSSGFEFFNFREDGSKTMHPYKFKWNKNRKDEFIDYAVA